MKYPYQAGQVSGRLLSCVVMYCHVSGVSIFLRLDSMASFVVKILNMSIETGQNIGFFEFIIKCYGPRVVNRYGISVSHLITDKVHLS